MKRLLSIRGVAAGHPCRVLPFVFVASLLIGVVTVSAQTTQPKPDAISAHMTQLQQLSARLPASVKDRLSTGAQHMLRTAEVWDQVKASLNQKAASIATLNAQPLSGTLPRGEVSDPSMDRLNRMGGFTQSETSTAWCGSNVVVGYNDSGSIPETAPILGLGVSFVGYSLSHDRGHSFTDQGYLNPGPNPNNFLGGDPVTVCADESTFYQSSLFNSVDVNFNPLNGVSVSKSTDGGTTFADPVAVVLKNLLQADGLTLADIIDKPWMTVDPSNPNTIYVTYTDIDFTARICQFGSTRIELVKSTDGGLTWGPPTIVDPGCFAQDEGSNVVVDGTGQVYVAWEQISDHSEIDFAKSADGGTSFAPKVTVAIVTPVGGFSGFGMTLQGGFRKNEFPSLAIDLSGRVANGPLYITWNDARFGIIPEFFGTYNFGDILVSRSGDGGLSWSTPVKVNDNNGAVPSPGADHYQPGIAVDHEGVLGVCFYDRRRDPQNFLIDRECATSSDKGQTWSNERVTEESFAPSIADDFFTNPTYMGDYDTVVSDALGRSGGFLGAYGDNSSGNPDVKISSRFGD